LGPLQTPEQCPQLFVEFLGRPFGRAKYWGYLVNCRLLIPVSASGFGAELLYDLFDLGRRSAFREGLVRLHQIFQSSLTVFTASGDLGGRKYGLASNAWRRLEESLLAGLSCTGPRRHRRDRLIAR
jgi:hypothetical protein